MAVSRVENPAPANDPFGFSRRGGTIHINGHRTSAKLQGSEHLTLGRSYVLFVEWNGGNYRLAGRMSGAVLIDDDFRTKPLGTKWVSELKKYDELSVEAFTEEVLKEPAP